ncbi:hypothetical protein V5O48_017209, partial [Marasmius crinis-equi]
TSIRRARDTNTQLSTPPPSPSKTRPRPPPSPEQQMRQLRKQVKHLDHALKKANGVLEDKDARIAGLGKLTERYGEEIVIRRQMDPLFKDTEEVGTSTRSQLERHIAKQD